MALENYYLDAGISKEKRIVAITNRIRELPYEAFKEKVFEEIVKEGFEGKVGRKHSAYRLYDYMKGRNFHVTFYERDRGELRQIIRDEIMKRKKRKNYYLTVNSTSERTISL